MNLLSVFAQQALCQAKYLSRMYCMLFLQKSIYIFLRVDGGYSALIENQITQAQKHDILRLMIPCEDIVYKGEESLPWNILCEQT